MTAFIAMALFALTMSISPGPVNVLTLSTGINHGFRKAMPFVSGATIGFTVLLIAIGSGIGTLVSENQALMSALSIGGSIYLCYMGFGMMTAVSDVKTSAAPVPTFFEGALLQWLNPKAWIASLAGTAAFNTAGSVFDLAVFVSLYFLICYASIASWAFTGDKIGVFFTSAKNLRWLNRGMGAGLVLIALYLFAGQYSSALFGG